MSNLHETQISKKRKIAGYALSILPSLTQLAEITSKKGSI